jgi:hypothetical protein
LAICAAVLPLPYRLDESGFDADDGLAAPVPVAAHVALEPEPPPVEHVVPFAVAFVGFTPAWVPAFWDALPFALVGDAPFLAWPGGTFAEFPGAAA